ncbi:MAG: hypothetical protein ACOYXT_18520 [Bacteroidota bacterium]
MRKTIFPYYESEMSAALEADPVLLDGMKVIFDKKTGLVPVEVEKKEPRNGTKSTTRKKS